MLNKMRKLNMELNEMQQKAVELKGKDIVFSAPTGCGKTEAILLALKDGGKVDWFLPTITSCIFMYKRLVRDFGDVFTISVATSVLTETHYCTKISKGSIRIMTPDPILIDYVKNNLEEENNSLTSNEILVLDEIDNYPPDVRVVLKHYIENCPVRQVIVASATLDKKLKDLFRKYELVKYDIDNTIKYKVQGFDSITEFENVVKKYHKKKRIAVIANSINNFDKYLSVLRDLGLNDRDGVLVHHANLTDDERVENEKLLFENNYDILISNDLISFSVDIDIDILVMEVSDKMNVSIQRLGRLNRRNKKVDFINLYIFDPNHHYNPKFIDELDAAECRRILESKDTLLTSRNINEFVSNLEIEESNNDFEDIVKYVKRDVRNDVPPKLRDVPLTFKIPIQVKRRRKGKKEAELVTTYKPKKWHINEFDFPWNDKAYSTPDCKHKDLVSLFYKVYIIKDLNQMQSGNIVLDLYEGECYSPLVEGYIVANPCDHMLSDDEFVRNVLLNREISKIDISVALRPVLRDPDGSYVRYKDRNLRESLDSSRLDENVIVSIDPQPFIKEIYTDENMTDEMREEVRRAFSSRTKTKMALVKNTTDKYDDTIGTAVRYIRNYLKSYLEKTDVEKVLKYMMTNDKSHVEDMEKYISYEITDACDSIRSIKNFSEALQSEERIENIEIVVDVRKVLRNKDGHVIEDIFDDIEDSRTITENVIVSINPLPFFRYLYSGKNTNFKEMYEEMYRAYGRNYKLVNAMQYIDMNKMNTRLLNKIDDYFNNYKYNSSVKFILEHGTFDKDELVITTTTRDVPGYDIEDGNMLLKYKDTYIDIPLLKPLYLHSHLNTDNPILTKKEIIELSFLSFIEGGKNDNKVFIERLLKYEEKFDEIADGLIKHIDDAYNNNKDLLEIYVHDIAKSKIRLIQESFKYILNLLQGHDLELMADELDKLDSKIFSRNTVYGISDDLQNYDVIDYKTNHLRSPSDKFEHPIMSGISEKLSRILNYWAKYEILTPEAILKNMKITTDVSQLNPGICQQYSADTLGYLISAEVTVGTEVKKYVSYIFAPVILCHIVDKLCKNTSLEELLEVILIQSLKDELQEIEDGVDDTYKKYGNCFGPVISLAVKNDPSIKKELFNKIRKDVETYMTKYKVNDKYIYMEDFELNGRMTIIDLMVTFEGLVSEKRVEHLIPKYFNLDVDKEHISELIGTLVYKFGYTPGAKCLVKGILEDDDYVKADTMLQKILQDIKENKLLEVKYL